MWHASLKAARPAKPPSHLSVPDFASPTLVGPLLCRHRARALHYRLLRRQLAAATGLEHSPLATEASDTSEGSSSTGSDTDSSSADSPAQEAPLGPHLQAAAGGALPPQMPALGTAAVIVHQSLHTTSRGIAEQEQQDEEQPLRQQATGAAGSVVEAGRNASTTGGGQRAVRGSSPLAPAKGELPATPLAVCQAVAADAAGCSSAEAGGETGQEQPSLPLPSNLADHLSDATPSSLAASDSPAGASWQGGSVSTSSCSTLQEVCLWPSCAGGGYISSTVPHPRGVAVTSGSKQIQQQQGMTGRRGLEALQALKTRLAEGRRAMSRQGA